MDPLEKFVMFGTIVSPNSLNNVEIYSGYVAVEKGKVSGIFFHRRSLTSSALACKTFSFCVTFLDADSKQPRYNGSILLHCIQDACARTVHLNPSVHLA